MKVILEKRNNKLSLTQKRCEARQFAQLANQKSNENSAVTDVHRNLENLSNEKEKMKRKLLLSSVRKDVPNIKKLKKISSENETEKKEIAKLTCNLFSVMGRKNKLDSVKKEQLKKEDSEESGLPTTVEKERKESELKAISEETVKDPDSRGTRISKISPKTSDQITEGVSTEEPLDTKVSKVSSTKESKELAKTNKKKEKNSTSLMKSMNRKTSIKICKMKKKSSNESIIQLLLEKNLPVSSPKLKATKLKAKSKKLIDKQTPNS